MPGWSRHSQKEEGLNDRGRLPKPTPPLALETSSWGERPKAVFLAGLPASGKSEYIKEFPDFEVVDCDHFKTQFTAFDPKRPQEVHEKSVRAAERRYRRCLAEKRSFVYDGLGKNVPKLSKKFQEARAAGFDVEYHYIECSLERSIERNAARERSVPNDVIVEAHDELLWAVPLLAAMADSFCEYLTS